MSGAKTVIASPIPAARCPPFPLIACTRIEDVLREVLEPYQGLWWVERYNTHARIEGMAVFRGDGHRMNLEIIPPEDN